MDRVSTMQEHGNSYSVKFLELTRMYSKNQDNIICIFEGQDEKYFSSRIDLKIGKDKWSCINSGGRQPVLDLYEAVSSHEVYKTANYYCFIDHDFQDWFTNPEPSRIYVTNGYSIENYYVSESCFKKVLSSEFGVSEFNEHKVDFEKCIIEFNSRLEEFISLIHPFNCWIKAHRIMEYKNEADNSFKTKDLSLYFRGKQQLDFFRLFLMKLKEDKVSDNPTFFASKGRVMISLSKDNCISELSQYAETPDCLLSFLENAKVSLAA